MTSTISSCPGRKLSNPKTVFKRAAAPDIRHLFQALFLLLEEVSHRPNRGTSKLIERRHIILDDNPRRIEPQQGHQWRKVQSAHLR